MWIETSPEVYAVIWAKHKTQLVVFSTFTDRDGDNPIGIGRPEIITEWGIKLGDLPLIKIRLTKNNKQEKDYNAEYFLYVHINEDQFLIFNF